MHLGGWEMTAKFTSVSLNGRNDDFTPTGLTFACLPENIPMQETWGAMEELVDESLTKNIGLRSVANVHVSYRLV
jgi:diketogulonate reductase-like aldo/keto reductase